MSHYPHDQDFDPLLSGEFSKPPQAPLPWPLHDTAPAPLEEPFALDTPRDTVCPRDLESLRKLLLQGNFHVMPVESCDALEKVAGPDCVRMAFETRVQHPQDDSAELATRLLLQHSDSHQPPCDMDKALRIARVLAHVPVVDLVDLQPQTSALDCLGLDMAARLQVLPLMREGDGLLVALGAPIGTDQQRMLRFVTQCRIVAVLASAETLHNAITRCYGGQSESTELESLAISEIEAGSTEDEQRLWNEAEALARQAPIVRLVNNILSEAISRKASDIHFRPGPRLFEVLYRINGTLVTARTMRRALLPPVVGRIKILASMNSSEHRLPQDGRIRYAENQADVDLRISIIPSQFGESVVIRVLARTADMRNLDAIGFEPHNLGQR